MQSNKPLLEFRGAGRLEVRARWYVGESLCQRLDSMIPPGTFLNRISCPIPWGPKSGKEERTRLMKKFQLLNFVALTALLLMLCSAPNTLHGQNTKRPTTEAGSRSASGSADACKDSTVKFDTPCQAILLANGFVYFGHLQDFGSAHPVMSDVFYIVTAHDESSPNPPKNILVKRGKELHAPDRMYLNPNQIVYVEPVGKDSKIAQLIAEAGN
jgi:hypothetical protein